MIRQILSTAALLKWRACLAMDPAVLAIVIKARRGGCGSRRQ
jgi:hypothetical protein